MADVNLSHPATVDSQRMRVRDLDTIEDFDAVVRLQRDVWGTEDDVVPRSVLAIAARTGGILIGADDDAGRLVGVVFSLPGLRHGRIAQWSHLLGVAPQARGQALGLLDQAGIGEDAAEKHDGRLVRVAARADGQVVPKRGLRRRDGVR